MFFLEKISFWQGEKCFPNGLVKTDDTKYHCDHHKNILCAHIQEVLWYILNANQHWFPSGRELFLHCFLYGLRHSVMLHLTTLQSVMSTQLIKNTCLIALLECGLKKFRFNIGAPTKVIYCYITYIYINLKSISKTWYFCNAVLLTGCQLTGYV